MMSNYSYMHAPAIRNTSLVACYGTGSPTPNNIVSGGPINSSSEKPLSESGATSCPRVSGDVGEFWGWLDEPRNFEWAVATFPVENGFSDRNIFVSKLPPSFKDGDLLSMFANFGEVVSAKVMLNVSTGASKETGFVQFAAAEDALRARCFLRLRPAVTEPAMPEVNTQWAQNKHDGGVYGDRSRLARKLFIRNIPINVTNDEMRALVTQFGDVAEVTLHADTYGPAAAAARGGGEERAEDAEAGGASGGAAAGEVVTPPPPPTTKRATRICFVTFIHPGVAARACAAIHNTRPFQSCGDVPLMGKVAEDNNARQARHQQGAMHHAGVRVAAAAAAATTYGSHPPTYNGQKGSGRVSPTANAEWLPYPPQNNNATPMTMMLQQPYQQPPSGYLLNPSSASVSAPFYDASQNQYNSRHCCPNAFPSSLPTAARHHPSSAAVAVNGGMVRLTFPPQNPHANVCSLDSAALAAASGTPRALSTTASPSMNLPVTLNNQQAEATEACQATRLAHTLSSTTSSMKTRIPATTTSAPTSARRASREALGHSPRNSFGADGAHMDSFSFSTSASANFSAEQLSSMSISTLSQQQQQLKRGKRVSDASQSCGVNFVTADAAVAAKTVVVTIPDAATTTPRRSRTRTLSSRSSDTTNSHGSNTHDATPNGLRVNISDAARPRRVGRRVRIHNSNAAAAVETTAMPPPSLSPHSAPQTAPNVSLVPVMTVTALSLNRAALEETADSPHSSSAYMTSHSTPSATPSCTCNTSQVRYRNNPYGMSIVLEKTRSASFT
ncbi:putative Rna binding protein [Leptomonas pyrrhocoris]|uniref:Putative Rna binding protein n=1 Tax=Leptomonas pyrrhocoris TaxID=157538 RepID=A0A0N0DVR9_LEPPY|nr:putative Rna binding protein [Leptomonas pyrrhocoris]KPA80504.1 putative Rna binding protein [Leptomonas pyrrhocoris]|eukprot:XP_015658943.1 putative Rna binding protein [Leptomonas pyrrhocoris]